MNRAYRSFIKPLILIACVALLSLGLNSCGTTAPAPLTKPQADADVGALQMGATAIFRVTVRSATGLEGSSHFNLLGEEATPLTTFATQLENYVVNKTSITLGIYDGGESMLAYTTLDALDYVSAFSGTLELTRGSVATTYAPFPPDPASPSSTTPWLHVQSGGVDVLARGLIENLATVGTFTDVRIPLYCGQVGVTFAPDAADGYFIINDVAIEFNYAFDNPVEFNDVLTIKFIESDRDFDNMQLYFKLPGAGRPVINARTGQVVPAGNLPQIMGGVSAWVTTDTPFDPAWAIADLTISRFGPATLVETTVKHVEGDCVLGARSFYVVEAQETPDPDAIKALGERFDKNTLEDTLVLLILGDEVDVRDRVLNTCDVWSASQSGGYGTTVDNWDISGIPAGAVFDFRFNAYSVPDKFIVEYPPGTLRLDTGWRGDSRYDGDPNYPGGIAGPGQGQEDAIFVRGTPGSFKVTVMGPDPHTWWDYSIRCRLP